jgi:hypothetical protein
VIDQAGQDLGQMTGHLVGGDSELRGHLLNLGIPQDRLNLLSGDGLIRSISDPRLGGSAQARGLELLQQAA